ncbi:MAG: DUF4282 domain-containing protein [bacterium]
MEQEGFLKALFDTRFTTLITPKIIRVVYIVAMIGIAIGAVIVVVSAFNNSTGLGLLTLLVLAPLGSLLYLILVRLYLEIVIVVFKINESADLIAAGAGGATGRGPDAPAAGAITPGAPGTPPATTS